jgi:TRAP transporter TAXI family solute receptor
VPILAPRMSGTRRGPAPAAVLAGVFLSLALAAAPVTASAQNPRFFRIGAGSTSGSNFAIGGAIANVLSNPPGARACDKGGSCGVPGLVAVAQTTQGSVENVALIARGAVDSALVQADIAYWAFHGSGPYAGKGAVKNLRAVATLYPEIVHIAVPAGGDIESVAALRLKRVSLGEQGSGTLVNARAILKAFGLGELDVVPFYLQPGSAADLMAEDGIDAFFVNAGLPAAAVAGLARTQPLRLLPIEGAEREALRRDYPFFSARSVPAGVYPGVAKFETLAVHTQLLVGEELDEKLVYGVVQALWHPSTQKTLEAAGRMAAGIAREGALDGLAVPLHPGAALWYFERGMIQGDGPRSRP